MPVNDYLVLLVTCTQTDAIFCLDITLICCCLLNTIIVIIIEFWDFSWSLLCSTQVSVLVLGIGIARGQYYWVLDIGCLSWYRSNPSSNLNDICLLVCIQVHLLGASLGGFLAQKFVEYTARSHRVQSLILCNAFTDTEIFDQTIAAPTYVSQLFVDCTVLAFPVIGSDQSVWLIWLGVERAVGKFLKESSLSMKLSVDCTQLNIQYDIPNLGKMNWWMNWLDGVVHCPMSY